MQINDLIVCKYADFLDEIAVCKILDIKHIERFTDDWYTYSGCIHTRDKDTDIIRAELVYSNTNHCPGTELFIEVNEAWPLFYYLNHKATWEELFEFNKIWKERF